MVPKKPNSFHPYAPCQFGSLTQIRIYHIDMCACLQRSRKQISVAEFSTLHVHSEKDAGYPTRRFCNVRVFLVQFKATPVCLEVVLKRKTAQIKQANLLSCRSKWLDWSIVFAVMSRMKIGRWNRISHFLFFSTIQLAIHNSNYKRLFWGFEGFRNELIEIRE